MPETVHEPSASERAPARAGDPARRRLLLWIPAAIFASVAATLTAAAFRFLRPPAPESPAGSSSGVWAGVAPVAELVGAQPIARTVSVEHRAGWSTTRREHAVFVLPHENNRVVSAVCPHEGCEVEWRGESREFFCPCHDSRFDAAGAHLAGPARSDLYVLPSRVEQGRLEVLYDTAPGGEPGTSPVQG